jgi:hypothetical protein
MTKLKVMVLGDMDLADKVEYNKFTENFEVVVSHGDCATSCP